MRIFSSAFVAQGLASALRWWRQPQAAPGAAARIVLHCAAWPVEAEGGTCTKGRDNSDLATIPRDDFLDDGKAYSRAFGGAVGAQGLEDIEDLAVIFRIYARSVVCHTDVTIGALCTCGNCDLEGPFAIMVFDRIAHQILQNTAKVDRIEIDHGAVARQYQL